MKKSTVFQPTEKNKQELIDRAITEAEYGNPLEIRSGEQLVAEELVQEGQLIEVGRGVFELTPKALESSRDVKAEQARAAAEVLVRKELEKHHINTDDEEVLRCVNVIIAGGSEECFTNGAIAMLVEFLSEDPL